MLTHLDDVRAQPDGVRAVDSAIANGGGGVRIDGGDEHAFAVDLAGFYTAHYRATVRLAGFLLGGSSNAEDIAQDAFITLAASKLRLRDPDKALAYLRQIVVNACRGIQRHQRVVDRHAAKAPPLGVVPSAESSAFATFDRHRLVVALQELPPRTREIVVLRYYCDLSEFTVAEMLHISRGAVKSMSSRGLASLALVLGDDNA